MRVFPYGLMVFFGFVLLLGLLITRPSDEERAADLERVEQRAESGRQAGALSESDALRAEADRLSAVVDGLGPTQGAQAVALFDEIDALRAEADALDLQAVALSDDGLASKVRALRAEADRLRAEADALDDVVDALDFEAVALLDDALTNEIDARLDEGEMDEFIVLEVASQLLLEEVGALYAKAGALDAEADALMAEADGL